MTPISGDANPLQAVSDALRQRDPRRAAAIAEAALKAGGRHPLLYTARAMWLSEQGHNHEALTDFRTAEAMGPVNPALKNAIALCLMRLDRPADAAREYDVLLALTPNAAPVHFRKGWALELAGDLNGARQALERAVACDPAFGEALARLAFLAARRAAYGEARAYAAKALALAPLPAAMLALAMAELDAGALAEAGAHARAVLEASQAGPTDRRMAAGLIGDICDRQDRCAEAFASYTEANQIAQALVPRAAAALSMVDTVRALVRHFEAMAPRPHPPAGPKPARHIFVLGFLRSGTTLIQEVLAARNDTVVLDEKDALGDAVEAFMTDISGLDRLWRADEAVLAQYRHAYWERVKGFGLDVSNAVLVDKMPLATVRIPLIQRLFPDAAIVFAMRDPRDVVWSCFRQRFVMNAATAELLTLDGAARLYDETMRLADLYRQKLSPRLFELRLEDLIADFDGRTRALCEFAGLAWQPGMREFADRSSDHGVTTPSALQVVRGLNRQGIGRWRRYAGPMAVVQERLAPWVKRFGYETDEQS
jgi:Tfp pilus assembly protein PilF